MQSAHLKAIYQATFRLTNDPRQTPMDLLVLTNRATKAFMRRSFSVAVYPRHQGRVLLIAHKRLGIWLPPGGELNEGETPLEAAARELREETGLIGRFPKTSEIDGTPLGFIGYEEHPAGSKGMHLNFVFVADVDTDEIHPNEEFTEWKWVSSFADIGGPPNVAQLGLVALAAPKS